MVDTKRTVTDLLTNLFQNGQAAGEITAQDVRDLIVSLGQPPVGALTMAGNSTETVVASGGTFYKGLGTTTFDSGVAVDVDANSADNRLRYTGTITRGFIVMASITCTATSSNKVIAFKFAKNGTPFGTQIQRKVGTGGDVGALALLSFVSLAENDYIELHATNLTDATNLTIVDLNIGILGLAG